MLYQLSYTPVQRRAVASGGREGKPRESRCYAMPAMLKALAMPTPGPLSQPIIDPELLLLAYRAGVFPMADRRDDPDVFWVEPRRRAILPLDGFHLSRSLARVLRRDVYRVTCNRAFGEVMRACAAPRPDADGGGDEVGGGDGDTKTGESWISDRLRASYQRLHEIGDAHSIECWVGGEAGAELVGGLYGVGFDRVFCGESMFSRRRDASKVALAWLVAALRLAGAALLDCQFQTPHLASMGAIELSQRRYKLLLRDAQHHADSAYHAPSSSRAAGGAEGSGKAGNEPLAAGRALTLPVAFAELLDVAAASSSSPGNFIAQLLSQTS